jgi:hypothetical protein
MSESSNAMKQEGFFVTEEGSGRRKKVVRQDRLQMEPGKCFLDFSGTRVEVLNISTFGCAVIVNPAIVSNLQAKFHRNNQTWQAKVFYDGTETQTLSLRFVRENSHVTSVSNEVVWAFEAIGEPFKMDRLDALERSSEIIRKQQAYATRISTVPLAFKKLIYELKDWFQKLKESVDDLEKQIPVEHSKDAEEFRMTIIANISDYLGQVLPKVYSEIPFLVKGLDKDLLQVATDFAREQLSVYVYGAPFAARSFYKPRGYAGDFEMMNFLYRDEAAGRTLYDQCVHKYFIDEPAGEAVKNRGQYLLEKITDAVSSHKTSEPLKILSVASGPAMEQQLFLENGKSCFGRNVEFTCLDQDEESLKHAQKQILSIDRFVKSGFTFKFTNMAIRNVIGRGLPENDYDVIYSAGLFDYLTEPVAQMAAQKMLASMKKGGKLIIGNFSKDNPSIPFMEFVLDWHLIYRSKEDLERMFKGFGSKVTVETEPLGVNLFVVIEK